MDNLAREAMLARQARMTYGRWKAMQEVREPKKTQDVLDGWSVCEWCGKMYKPKTKRPQKYCEPYCQQEAQKQRSREKNAKYMREYRARMGEVI